MSASQLWLVATPAEFTAQLNSLMADTAEALADPVAVAVTGVAELMAVTGNTWPLRIFYTNCYSKLSVRHGENVSILQVAVSIVAALTTLSSRQPFHPAFIVRC